MSKRVFDIVASLLGLLLLAPVFLLIAAMVKRDSSGPVFYRQERVGRNGVVFRIIKFRTMHVACTPQREITVSGDSRITAAGSILRRYKLDELPQLINVLLGEMSLVGPRPEVPRYVAVYPEETRRIVLSMLPGITDWASIYFRDENDILATAPDPEAAYVQEVLPAKLAYCLRYAAEQSFMTDLKIIFLTVAAIGGRAPAHSQAA